MNTEAKKSFEEVELIDDQDINNDSDEFYSDEDPMKNTKQENPISLMKKANKQMNTILEGFEQAQNAINENLEIIYDGIKTNNLDNINKEELRNTSIIFQNVSKIQPSVNRRTLTGPDTIINSLLSSQLSQLRQNTILSYKQNEQE